MKENKTPTGLPGGFFVYNAEGDEEIGCIRAQGYYFGKPESLSETRLKSEIRGAL